ncbi:MAG: flagellar motor protein [Oligoflexales bacterium]|nr:flagellar motor protein [Oligoflexales bacterium]
MDITSILGPVISLGMILGGMILEGGHMSSVLQLTAAMIVFGGAFGALMVGYTLQDIIHAFKAVSIWLKNSPINTNEILDTILDLAATARKESILALEKKRASISYAPLAKAVKLAVDGTDPAIIRETLETEAHVVEEESEISAKFFEDFGGIAPTIGILGAVIGLIHVMNNLNNPDAIGPGIAVAFVATLYGVGSANIFGIPVAKKLKRKALIDKAARDMVMIGVDGILAGLNPKVIEEKLAVFCPGRGGEE